MGEPLTGAWQRENVLGYTDARKWGTGVNPVHAYRGDPGRPRDISLRAEELTADDDRRHPANIGVADLISGAAPFGYNPEDIAGLDVFSDDAFATIGEPFYPDDYPHWSAEGPGNDMASWNVDIVRNTPQTRSGIPPYSSRPWNITGAAKNILRGIRGGPHSVAYRGISSQIPMETVNEGWLNKPSSGRLEDGPLPNANPSDDSQIFVQTSMRQRYNSQDNDRALARSGPEGFIDHARHPIESRVAPMKVKAYSGEQRHYDMFPYQIDDMPRPFSYRRAGVGPEGYLEVNDQWEIETYQRTPAADPSMGTPDTQLADNYDYGYVPEDVGYY